MGNGVCCVNINSVAPAETGSSFHAAPGAEGVKQLLMPESDSVFFQSEVFKGGTLSSYTAEPDITALSYIEVNGKKVLCKQSVDVIKMINLFRFVARVTQH